MEKDNILFSVIIPQRNCSTLTRRCLNSIPDEANVQVIIVDDNSNAPNEEDELVEMCGERNALLILDKQGGGAGHARNLGLAVAKGKWLLFADADDLFSESAFAIFDEYKDSSSDLIVFKHYAVVSDTGEKTIRSDARNKYIDDFLNKASGANEAKLRLCNDVPWAKMIRRELVGSHNIKFDEVPASNDTTFSLMVGYYANAISADTREVYCVTVREGSITKTKSVDRYFSDHCVALRKNKFVREIGHPECQEIIITRLFLVLKKYGLGEFFRFMKEVKRYHGKLFYGFSRKLKIKKK